MALTLYRDDAAQNGQIERTAGSDTRAIVIWKCDSYVNAPDEAPKRNDPHPTIPGLVCIGVRIEGIIPRVPEAGEEDGPTYEQALIYATYSSLAGTELSSGQVAVEAMEVGIGRVYVGSGAPCLTPVNKLIFTEEFSATTYYPALTAPWTNMRALRGCVNTAGFVPPGQPDALDAGSVLFCGADYRLYTDDSDIVQVEFTYRFLHKTIDGVPGHNLFWDGSTGYFVSCNPAVYLSGDFALLFPA
jgi:hypothetical protein